MKKIIVVLFVLISISCAEYKKVTYKAFNYDSNDDLKITLDVPRGYKLIKNSYDHSVEYHYVYKDSSIIFISNNKFSASRINKFNRIDKGIDVIVRKHINDTVIMEGKKAETFWKEGLFDNISVGYLNVPKERKKEFDKSIESLVFKNQDR